MDIFDLGILRLALELRSRCSLQVYIKEIADVVCRYRDLAAAIEAQYLRSTDARASKAFPMLSTTFGGVGIVLYLWHKWHPLT